MQLSPETLDAATRALKTFRFGGTIIAMIPAAFALIPVIAGGRASSESVPFVVSMTLILLVTWTNH